MSYAILDLETTGLDATVDRVIDIAIIQVDENLRATATYTWLVNPGREVTASHIHGLTDQDVADKPLFVDILPELIELLRGRAIVAHNSQFDIGFLNAEFARSGYDVVIPKEATICTLDQSRIYLPEGRHSLVACLERAQITLRPQHRALADATCCHELFRSYVEAELAGRRFADVALTRDGSKVFPRVWESATEIAQQLQWPTLPMS